MQPISREFFPAQLGAVTNHADDFGVRIGQVTAYDSGSITVSISGSNVLVSAAYLSSYFPNINDLVAVLKYGATWLVLGGFGQTQSRYIPVAAVVAAGESTSNAGYVDLTTPGPIVTVNIGASGSAMIMMTAEIVVGGVTPGGTFAAACYEVTDALGTVTQVGDGFALMVSDTDTAHNNDDRVSVVNFHSPVSNPTVLLPPGPTQFKMKYRSVNGGNVTFGSRMLVVTPF